MSSVYGYYSSSIGSKSTSLGISGLISGMDIDATVKAMSSGTSAKISKVQQNLMKLEWKQAAYHEVSTALTDFKNKYMSSTSASSISNLLANCYNIESEGDNAKAVSASGSPDILENFSVLSVSQLASTASFTSARGITGSGIKSGVINFSDETTAKSTLEGKNLSIKVGSETFTLTFDDTIADTESGMLKAVQNAIDNATGSAGGNLASKIKVSMEGGKLTFKSNNSDTLLINSSSDALVLKALGLQSVAGEKNATTIQAESTPNYGSAVNQVSFFTTLADGSKSMTLDLSGVQATVKFDSEMINAIKEAGAAAEAAGNDKSSAMLEKMVDEINDQLEKVYGSKVKTEANYVENADGTRTYDGTFSFNVTDNTAILSVASGSSDLLGESGILGIKVGAANRLLLDEPLQESNFASPIDFGKEGIYKLNLNGVNFEISQFSISVDGQKTDYKNGVTMRNIMSAINGSDANVKMSYLSTTDRFTITSNVAGSAGKIDMSGSLADALFGNGSAGSGTIQDGKNADGNEVDGYYAGTDAEILVSFDGKTVEKITRSTNSFTIDGLSLSIKSTFNEDLKADQNNNFWIDKDGNGTFDQGVDAATTISAVDEAVSFTKSVNTEELIESIKTMVEDYNKMIELVMGHYKTKPDKEYQPLTEDMIEEENLNDEQAEMYNDKAKEGILYGDSILRSLSNDMRYIFSNISFTGITTSSDYTEYGKLSFDEAQFKSAMEADPEKIKEIFNNESTGVLAKLDKMMDKYVNPSIATPGLLTAKAGLASSSISQMSSAIYRERNSLNDMLSDLQDKLERQQDRYYARFTDMEVALYKIQNQSSYLSSLAAY